MIQDSQFIPPGPLSTAVLFLVFNRPDTTKKVFEAIRQAKPPRLYIAADGPRGGKKGEAERVDQVRNYVINNIDWPCDVKTLFRDDNLGCKYAVSGAISWFFDQEEQGIILEDDCLPSQSFFWYCEELLNRYKESETVYLISGDARGSESLIKDYDYSFCKYPLIWGWASWRRVWEKYDPEIKEWPECSKKLIGSISNERPTKRFWYDAFSSVYNNKIDTWDFQFSYLLLKNGGKCVVPKFNLISNIGFGENATHTLDQSSASANRELANIKMPLSEGFDKQAEHRINIFYDDNEFFKMSLLARLLNRVFRSVFGKSIF